MPFLGDMLIPWRVNSLFSNFLRILEYPRHFLRSHSIFGVFLERRRTTTAKPPKWVYHWRNFARFFITQFFFNNQAASKRWMIAKVRPFLFVGVFSKNKDITPKCFLNWTVFLSSKIVFLNPNLFLLLLGGFKKTRFKQYLAKGQRHGSHPPFFRPAGPFPTVRAKCDVQVVEMRHRTSVGFHVVLVMPGWWFQIFFIFTFIWGKFPICLIFFKWVETTN